MKTAVIVGTFDTKGIENKFLIGCIEKLGLKVISINMGIKETALFKSTYSAEDVANAHGTSLSSLAGQDRSQILDALRNGAAEIVKKLCIEKNVDGIIAMGGGQGTWMVSAVFRAVPIGIPKVLISTVALIDRCQSRFHGINDTYVVNSLVDISGLNPALCTVLDNAACALAGMVQNRTEFLTQNSFKKRIGITMWGVTTPCVQRIQHILEKEGPYEVYVFHATGMGGLIMDNLVKQGFFHGIADITLPEVTIPLTGGTYPQNEERLYAASRLGIPQLIVPGGVDMIETSLPIPEKFSGREVYMHNTDLPFVRSTPDENVRFAKEIAKRLNSSNGPVKVLLPLKGLSASDCENTSFHNESSNRALFETLHRTLKKDIDVLDINAHINDAVFADEAARQMMLMM